jgi:hypothetical protein
MNLDMQSMYDLVGDRLQEIFDAQVVDIGVLDESAGMIHFPYTIEKGVRFQDEPMAVIGFRKRVLENREPLLFHTVTAEILEQYDQPKSSRRAASPACSCRWSSEERPPA